MGALIIILIVLVVVIIALYNGLVQSRMKVKNAWSQIDVQLQRRFDLIPNLVEVVKQYTKHEESTLTKIAELRTSWANATTVGEKANLDSELSGEFKKALLETKFGKTLIEALEDMKKRIPSETINNIILNITQTSEFGNSIINVMNNQVDFLREKQILEVKSQINKIPNKVSIISVIFIIPLILLIILGPFLIGLL